MMQARFRSSLSLLLVFYLNWYEVGSNILNFHDAGGSVKQPKELEVRIAKRQLLLADE
jgi:hypothetical protein